MHTSFLFLNVCELAMTFYPAVMQRNKIWGGQNIALLNIYIHSNSAFNKRLKRQQHIVATALNKHELK